MFCVSCGKSYESYHKFCNNCGQPLTATGPEPPLPPMAPAQTIAAPTNSASTAQYDTEPIEPISHELEKPDSAKIADGELRGLRGWLILVAFGLFAGLLYWSYAIFQSVTLFNDGTVQFLSDPSSSVHIAGYSGLLKFELIGQFVLVATDVCLLNLFLRKSSLFPSYYTAFLVTIVIFTALDYFLVSSALTSSPQGVRKTLDETMSGQASQIARSAVAAVVWGLYMVKSKRVKATFID